jgi:hypothetical protein
MDKQEFLILGKSAKGRALCELISRATAEPGIHTFGELLCMPNVQEVCGGGGSTSWHHQQGAQGTEISRIDSG